MKYTLSFQQIDKAKLPLVGGKGANLGELSTIEGVHVPRGFCVTTLAYKEVIEHNGQLAALLKQLNNLRASDRKGVSEVSAMIRQTIEAIAIPDHIAEEIESLVGKSGEGNAYAVRSSATAEDLPTASFAGQQDTFLNVIGTHAILKHVSKCWLRFLPTGPLSTGCKISLITT